MWTIKLANLLEKAVGIHKVEKVKILRTVMFARDTPYAGVDYAIILLDNGITFPLFPWDEKIDEKCPNGGYVFKFGPTEELLIMSEGETFIFQRL